MIHSLIKPLNFMSAGYSLLKSYLTHKAEISGMPVNVSIELTNHCNLRCPECFCGSGKMTRPRGFMDLSLFEKIVTELKPYLWEMNLYFQGESMLHPQFCQFLEKSRGIRTTLATNGHFLSPDNAEMLARSGLNKVIVSLDGMDQETYSAYRVNGDIDIVKEGIRNLSFAIEKNKSSMKLVIQYLVNSKNEKQLPEAKRFAGQVNASLRLKSMQIINDDTYEKWLPSKKRFRRYEPEGNGYKIISRLPDYCLRMWFNPVITWDGKVIPCCFDKDANHIMGDMKESSFREIWTGPRYILFRKSIMTGRKTIKICYNCTSGLSRKINR